MKKLIAAIGLLISLSSQAQQPVLEPGQIYTTPNVVLPTVSGQNTTPWVNGVYQDSLTCWAWGNPGYCGPNAIVRPGNNINFSFGQTDLYQSQAISNILPNSGTGLRVNGYNFSFTAKNGNGWDDGRTDYLYAYTHLTNQNNQVVHYKTYNLSYQFNWSTFNYSETFNTPFASKDLKNVTYGFVGRDNNGWAGPYGPEINSVSFSLKYSVDPCATNPLYSPTCPGYTEAFNKLMPTATAQSSTIASSEPISSPVTASAQVQEPVSSPSPSTSSPVARTETVSVASSSPIASTSSNTATAAAVASSPSPSREVNANSLSIGLSVVARNQQREQTLALQTAQNAVAATEQTAQQAQQEAVSIAASSSANSAVIASSPVARQIQLNARTDSAVQNQISQSQISSTSLFNQPSQVSASRTNESRSFTASTIFSEVLVPPITQAVLASTQPVVQSAIQTSSVPVVTSSDQVTTSQTSTTFSLLPPTPVQQITPVMSSSVVQDTRDSNQNWSISTQSQFNYTTEVQSLENTKNLTDRSNPINAILNERNIEMQSSQPGVQRASVNTNAANNEVAGGVDLNRMAIAPSGYNQYLNLIIADAAFYAPKEVYRNQRTVDNVRALRSLSSDRLHQEMVDQQYRK